MKFPRCDRHPNQSPARRFETTRSGNGSSPSCDDAIRNLARAPCRVFETAQESRLGRRLPFDADVPRRRHGLLQGGAFGLFVERDMIGAWVKGLDAAV